VGFTVPNEYDEWCNKVVKDALFAAGVPRDRVDIIKESNAATWAYLRAWEYFCVGRSGCLLFVGWLVARLLDCLIAWLLDCLLACLLA
jgi:hypothetical protein